MEEEQRGSHHLFNGRIIQTGKLQSDNYDVLHKSTGSGQLLVIKHLDSVSSTSEGGSTTSSFSRFSTACGSPQFGVSFL